jgi:hypothetical protein
MNANPNKLQASSPKIQRSAKPQTPIVYRAGFWSLKFEVSLELGAWSLELSTVADYIL